MSKVRWNPEHRTSGWEKSPHQRCGGNTARSPPSRRGYRLGAVAGSGSRSTVSYEELLADRDIKAGYRNPLRIVSPRAARSCALEGRLRHPLKTSRGGCGRGQQLVGMQTATSEAQADGSLHVPASPAVVTGMTVQEGDRRAADDPDLLLLGLAVDPTKACNMADIGGGSMLDAGCYCISLAVLFRRRAQPRGRSSNTTRRCGPTASRLGILDFGRGATPTTCSTGQARPAGQHLERRGEMKSRFRSMR